jgi:hypothetical protein
MKRGGSINQGKGLVISSLRHHAKPQQTGEGFAIYLPQRQKSVNQHKLSRN